jgi:hypothetical protein
MLVLQVPLVVLYFVAASALVAGPPSSRTLEVARTALAFAATALGLAYVLAENLGL